MVKDATIMLHLTAEEKEDIKKAAARERLSVNSWAMQILTKAAADINRLPPEP